jgi:hypothetical protein
MYRDRLHAAREARVDCEGRDAFSATIQDTRRFPRNRYGCMQALRETVLKESQKRGRAQL